MATPIEDDSGHALGHFYRALERTARGHGRTHIVLWGDSHMAADVFTLVVRHRLMKRFGDAGIGYVVPAWPWQFYYNRDANISYSHTGWKSSFVTPSKRRDDGLYGLAGVSFTSRSRKAWAKVTTARKSHFGRRVNRVTVYYWRQPRGGDLLVTFDGRHTYRLRTRRRHVQPGRFTYRLRDGPHSVVFRPAGNGPVTLFGVALDRTRPGVEMDHIAINGARAASQLLWSPKIFASELKSRTPDLVVLAYGTNELDDTDQPIEAYEQDLAKVVARIRHDVPKASCLLIGPTDRPVVVHEAGEDEPSLDPRPREDLLREAQRRVAKRFGCGWWDWVAAMGGPLSMMRWVDSEPRYAQHDYVHLTVAGYQRSAGLFMDALMAPFERFVARTGGIPKKHAMH